MDKYSLSVPQRNIYDLQKFYNDSAISNICGVVYFNEHISSEVLSDAINHLITIQDGFRLQLIVEESEVKQFIAKSTFQEIKEHVFNDEISFREYAENFAKEKFEIIGNKLYRFEIIQLPEKTALLACFNHLIADAWTFSIAVRTVCEYIKKHQSSNCINVSQADISSKENENFSYVEYLDSSEKYFQSKRYEKDKEFWEGEYSHEPQKAYIKPETLDVKNPEANRNVRLLSLSDTNRIEAFCDDRQISPAILFETAVFIYLNRINRENTEATIGIPVLNRNTIVEKNTAGMFISTMPLTMQVSGNISDFMNELVDKHNACFRHQKYPYSEILGLVRNKYGVNGNLYDVMVSYQNATTDEDVRTEWFSNGASEVPLTLSIDRRDGGNFRITEDYQIEKIGELESELLLDRILFIVNQIVSLSDQTDIHEIDIIPSNEKETLINEFNNTAINYPKDKCIYELFEEQAFKRPEEIALIFDDEKFTYRHLNEMANSLAHYLREVVGIRPNDVVPIIAIRDWRVIVAMFAIMKAGGAYMPVDPAYPADRINYMLETAGARVALCYKDETDIDCTKIDLINFDFESDVSPIDSVNSSKDYAYILFTSGTTGNPKAVTITHRNLTNFCHNNNNNNKYQCNMLNTCKTVLGVTTFTFDISVFEIFLTLTNGLRLVLADDEQNTDGKRLAELVEKYDVDVIHSTPTKFLMYLQAERFQQAASGLKMLMIGAEAFTEEIYRTIRKYTKAKIYNGYGPSETTIGVSFKNVDDTLDITIGKPIANTQIYMVDKSMQLVPLGVAGELCIAGDGVGAGYLNRPELTKEKFVSNPFATEENGHGKILYKTGDLARWREDGEIEYLGRIDTQIKIRGLRVELGEIESLIASFEGVKLSAATDKKDSTGRQYLVGYYTSDVEIDENELRKHLSEKLPKYMVPNYFVHLASMPLTTSGKTDRKNLPEPDFKVREVEYVAPKSELERTVCNLLADLLKVDQVGLLDDFFSLGGDSLLAIQFITEAHVKGIEIPLQKIFDHPVVKDLCESLSVVENQVQYTVDDFKKYEGILSKNVIPTNPDQVELRKKDLGIVVLTGATGFLGVHILDELLKQNESVDEVYCLIRDEEKFRNTLQYYFNSKYETTSKIHVVIGDITDENIANKLPGKVNTVIHAAASVKHYGAYSEFENINVFGTKHMVEYAKQNNARYIHISTISVSGNSFADAFTMYRSEKVKYFTEQDLFINQELNNVYIHSKFEAEKAVLDAVLEGLDGHIVRVGNLTNRNSDYKFQPNYKSNAFLTRIKAGFEFGYIPDYMMPLYAEFSPIDCTAEGIVKIAEYADDQCVFNLNSNCPIYFTTLLDVLHKMKVKMEVVDGKRFNELLNQEARDKGTEYIYQAFQNDMNEEGKLVYDSNIRIINDFTIWFMKKTGFEWPQTDERYIRGYINYFRELGYLEV